MKDLANALAVNRTVTHLMYVFSSVYTYNLYCYSYAVLCCYEQRCSVACLEFQTFMHWYGIWRLSYHLIFTVLVRLHGTKLNVRQVKKLRKGLKRHPSIVSLDLGDCGLTDESIQYVARLLRKPKEGGCCADGRHEALRDSRASHSLKELNLSANAEVTLLGWTQIAIGLARNTTLEQLYLDYNDLLPEGAAVLAVAISVHPEIRFVDLEGCGIGDDGASYILAALRKPGPPKLEKLVLTNNDISVEKVETITALLPPPV